MSHDTHEHDSSHGHDHSHHEAPKHDFFDGGGVAAVGWIWMLFALGVITWLLVWG